MVWTIRESVRLQAAMVWMLNNIIKRRNGKTYWEVESYFERYDLCFELFGLGSDCSNFRSFQVVVPGTGDRRPINGDLVIIRVEGQLENGQKVDCCDELPFLIGHSEVIPGTIVCLVFQK